MRSKSTVKQTAIQVGYGRFRLSFSHFLLLTLTHRYVVGSTNMAKRISSLPTLVSHFVCLSMRWLRRRFDIFRACNKIVQHFVVHSHCAWFSLVVQKPFVAFVMLAGIECPPSTFHRIAHFWSMASAFHRQKAIFYILHHFKNAILEHQIRTCVPIPFRSLTEPRTYSQTWLSTIHSTGSHIRNRKGCEFILVS